MSSTEPLPVKLAEVCDVNPTRPNLSTFSDDTPVLFVPMKAVDDVSGTIVDLETRPLRDFRAKSYRSFTPGDILFAKITPCMENGKSAIVPSIPSGLGFGSTEFHVLRPKPGVQPRYIWHLVRQLRFRRLAEQQMKGSVGQARVPGDFLKTFPILLPDAETQRAVVQALDTIRTLSHAAMGHLSVARRAIERFRQAVLAAACSGRLTAGWRKTRPDPGQSADELLRQLRSTALCLHLESSTAAKPLDMPQTWRIATGAEVFAFVTSGSRGWAKYYSDEGASFIRVGNLDRHRLDLDVSVVQAVTPPQNAEATRTRVQSGDLLISITAEVGMVGVVPPNLGESYVSQHIAIARPHPQLNPRFLAAFVAAPSYGEAQLDAVQKGATKAGLGLDDVRALRISLPPSEEQIEIARCLDQLMSIADDLDARIDAASHHINQTSQAVLAKAFRGELLSQPGSTTSLS